jgi:hypothetical protein
MPHISSEKYSAYSLAALAIAISLFFKLSLIKVGAPYTTIDDNTLFNAGFLVWFGEAPPQRMYLESWLTGLTSIITYVFHLISSGQISQLGMNLVADAFRDFQNNPSDYVHNYRYLMLGFDLLTAFFIFRLSALFFDRQSDYPLLALVPACLYLLTYNTLWCNLVARPDTMTAFFAVLGVYSYFLSAHGTKTTQLYWSAVFLGCATGFKLHAAMFVIAILIDLIRVHGIKTIFYRGLLFGVISVFIFCVVAGSPLFDPLLYIKLRALNVRDDASPWIKQGEQFLVILRSSGWFIIPLVLGAIFIAIKGWQKTTSQSVKSLIVITSLFLILFCSLRVLRGYWMLPALALFYILATYAISQIKYKSVIATCVLVLFGLMSVQTYQQAEHFKAANYNDLQNWIKANVKPQEKFYVIGFDTVFLPKNTAALQTQKEMIEQGFNSSVSTGESFTMRHVRLWEERAQLLLIDMLNAQSSTGYEYYALNSAPFENLKGTIEYQDFAYFLVMKGITNKDTNGLLAQVQSDYIKVAEANSPGGKSGTGGLTFEIYARKAHAQ